MLINHRCTLNLSLKAAARFFPKHVVWKPFNKKTVNHSSFYSQSIILSKLACHMHFKMLLKTFLLLIISADLGHGANILFFFTGGTYSHDIAVWPWVIRLAERNHSVTFFSAHSKKPWRDPRVRVIAPPKIEEINSGYLGDTLKFRLAGEERLFWWTLPGWSSEICEWILTNPDKPETKPIFSEKYDIVILDAALCDCGHIMGYYHKAKVIVSDSTSVLPWFHDVYGIPAESSWVPATSTFFHFHMNLVNIVDNYLEPHRWTYLRRTELHPRMNALMKELFKNESGPIPTFSEIERRADLVFVNTHPTVELPRAFPPNVIEVGGMQLFGQENASISKEVESFMEKAEKGVILLAFGSTVDFSSLPSKIEAAFFKGLKRFPEIHFIGKAQGTRPANCPENLRLEKWLPQKEILAHSKTIACITHGGLNGILEATWNGIPLITVPIFAEQDHQSYKLEARGVGIRLEVRDLTEDILVSAISSIITDPKYRENMRKLQAAFRDRPVQPLDLAIYWTEFLLRHPDVFFMNPITYQTWRVVIEDWFYAVYSPMLAIGLAIIVLLVSVRVLFRK